MIALVHQGASPRTSWALNSTFWSPIRESPPRVETARRVRAGQLCAAAAFVVSVAACGTDGPAPTPIQNDEQRRGVRGTVMDWTVPGAPRPVPHLRLQVRAKGPTDGAVGGEDLPDVVTDENGRYEITEATQHWLFFRTAPGADYKFLCPFYPASGRPFDRRPQVLPVVHASWSGDALPAMFLFIQAFGVVSERADEQLRPVAGATVMFENGLQDPPSTTSDSGFYGLCSIVGADQTRTVTARKDGYRTVSRDFFQLS